MKSPKISIIIPFKNSERTIRKTLSSVYSSRLSPYELIVVNDHSEDCSVEIVKSFPCILIKNTGKMGVSSARNLGAQKASGDILLFIDSDIVLKKNTLENLTRCYQSFDADGIVGVLSEKSEFNDFYSKYKNLWMRYTYLLLENRFPPFYSSIASLKKASFEKTEGFPERYQKPGVEDTVFGNYLLRNGYKVRLCPDVEVLHLKKYSFFSLLKTDFQRASQLTDFFSGNILFLSIILDSVRKKKKDSITSVPYFFLFSFIIEFVFGVLGFWKLFNGEIIPFLGYLIIGWILTNLSNLPWLLFLKRIGGMKFATKAFLFLPLEVFVSIMGGITRICSSSITFRA